jgi:hypothetical protein
MKHNCHHLLLGLIISTFYFYPPMCRADLMFDVTLVTSGLVGINQPAAPFFIDFQLNDGSGNLSGVNTAIISNFNFGGGVSSGPPHLVGGAMGDLDTAVTLTDNAHFLNEFFQQLIPQDVLSFHVSLTTNVDSGPTPDAFSFSILDRSGAPIPTTNFADAFIFININSANLTVADLGNSIFAGDPNREPLGGGDVIPIGKPQIPGVPEVPETGSSISMLLIGLGAVWWLRRRFSDFTAVANAPKARLCSKSKLSVLRYYLSSDDKTAFAPFSTADVKWMIPCHKLARDVIIKAENEGSWMRYSVHCLGRFYGQRFAPPSPRLSLELNPTKGAFFSVAPWGFKGLRKH